MYVRVCVSHNLCVFVVICITPQADSPASIKLPHILLEHTFYNVSVLDKCNTLAQSENSVALVISMQAGAIGEKCRACTRELQP